jgi:uncharacterized protein (DUF302 family)
MAITEITVERFSVTSSRSFERVVAALKGHLKKGEVAAAKTFAELEEVVQKAVGESGFIEFAQFDLGAVLRLERSQSTPKILRLVIGNPLIMKEMVKHVPDAGSYAPVTVLIDERSDGVHLSYDRMASLLASYASPDALKVARDLDSKVEKLLAEAAGVV